VSLFPEVNLVAINSKDLGDGRGCLSLENFR
jgi:hypothetical protein